MRPAIAYRTQLTLGRVDNAAATAALARDMFSERRTVEAAISTLPLVWGQGLTAYLENYEYSCTEQLVSKGMSLLILTSRPEFGAIRNRDAQPLEGAFSMLRSRAERAGRIRIVVVIADHRGVPHGVRRAFSRRGEGPGSEDSGRSPESVNQWLTRFASTPASSSSRRALARVCRVSARAPGHQA